MHVVLWAMVRPRPTKPSRYLLPSQRQSPNRSEHVSFLNQHAHHRPALSDQSDQPLLHVTPPQSPTSSYRSSSHTGPSRLLSVSISPVFLLVIFACLATPYLLAHVPRFLRSASLPRFFSNNSFYHFDADASLIVACTDRHQILARALVSWLQVSHVRQILLVDWSSSPPLQGTVDAVLDIHAPRSKNVSIPDVRIVRVDDESSWVPSRAYNLAARSSMYDTLFKVDCDVLVSADAMIANPIPYRSYSFFAGHRILARSAKDFSLEGTLIIQKSHFLSVGGYDERIQTYGHEDEDLYSRLEAAGFTRGNLSYATIDHIFDRDVTASFPFVQAAINHALLAQISTPWSKTDRPSQYSQDDNNPDKMRATYIPPSIESMVPTGVVLKLRTDLTRLRLYQRHQVPRAVINSMQLPVAERLLRNLDEWNDGSQYDEVLHPEAAPPLVMVHVQNGIGNRLRVLGSALAFAGLTDREPIIIWEPDVHFGARFDQLFNISSTRYPVIDAFQPQWPLRRLSQNDSTWNRFSFYNYMLDTPDRPKVEDELGRSIYFKSSAIMNSDITSWETENDPLLSLVVRDDISRLVDNTLKRLDVNHVGGVHIRNRSLDVDIPGVSDTRKFYYKRDMTLIDKW